VAIDRHGDLTQLNSNTRSRTASTTRDKVEPDREHHSDGVLGRCSPCEPAVTPFFP
jgi:hypothetical protein